MLNIDVFISLVKEIVAKVFATIQFLRCGCGTRGKLRGRSSTPQSTRRGHQGQPSHGMRGDPLLAVP